MAVSDRFTAWLLSLSAAWKDTLRGWLLRTIGEGITKFSEDIEPDAKDLASEAADALLADPNIPEMLKNQLRHATKAGNILETIYVEAIILLQTIPVLLGGSAPLSRLLEYSQDRLKLTARLDPAQVITAWRRNPSAYEQFFEDLKELGWSEERIETLKEISLYIPGAADIIRFAVREVYDPAVTAKYGQFEDFPTAAMPDAEKAGLPEATLRKFWAAHWDLPSATLGYEMLHRGIITEDELGQLLRALDVMPYWRPKLAAISWNVPTRVDVRRFWDLRTIDEPRLREIYTALGYHGKDLDDYVLWTKIYVELPELVARWKNGWITQEQVIDRLVTLGMDRGRAETLLEAKIKAEPDPATAGEKNLTLTDIYKAVKLGRISRAQAIGLIVELGYTEDQAEFKLDINVPEDSTEPAIEERQLAKADILAGLKAGIIDESQARTMLLDLRYAAVDVEYLLKLFRAQVTPPATPELKEASKADITAGVRRGVISPEEGYVMLITLGFSGDAAEFILSIIPERTALSPSTFEELEDQAQRYRRVSGLPARPVSEDLKRAGAALVKAKAEADALQRAVRIERANFADLDAAPPESKAKLTELQQSLYKAEAELRRQQVDYDAMVADWKHRAAG